ncbi:MAG: tetratricopeptide repeat protein [Sphingobacteriaceae bacterium]|nr:tetratricopeptide repeat protein [Sphingobacteriaceae bacterium]
MNWIKIGCLLTLFSLRCIAQEGLEKKYKRIDSLKFILAESKIDTVKVDVLIKIAKSYLRIDEVDEAVNAAADALTISGNIGFKKGIALSYMLLASTSRDKADYDKSEEYYNKSLIIFQELKDQKNIGLIYGHLGILYRLKGDLYQSKKCQEKSLLIAKETKDSSAICTSLNSLGAVSFEIGERSIALDYYIQASRIAQKLNLKKEIASTLNNIANIYISSNNFEKAIEYYERALQINEEMGYKKWQAINLSNLASCYSHLKNYDKALELLHLSKQIRDELGDKKGLTFVIFNLAETYSFMGSIDEAIANYNACLNSVIELGDKNKMADCYVRLGLIYAKKGDKKKAVEYIEKAIQIASKLESRFVFIDIYYNASEVYNILKNFELAFKYHKGYTQISDSFINQKNNEQIALLNTKYDAEQKDIQIKLLNIENEKNQAINESTQKEKNIIIVSGSSILLLIFIVTIITFRAYRRKKKDNKEIKTQKEIVESKRKEVEASITYAYRIQSAILPSDQFIADTLPHAFVIYKPKDIVSGDFYWVEKIRNKILIAVVDCTGHGVPGAMMSVVGYNALNRTVKEFNLSKPSLILDKLNELVEDTFAKSKSTLMDGMDISLCLFDPDSLVIEWAGANNPLWIISNNELVEIKGDKQPIGKFENRKPFTNHTKQLKKGDQLVLLSDGFADQFGGPKGKKFKYKKLMQVLLELQGKATVEQKINLEQEFETWKGNQEQVDDVCLFGLNV